MPDSEYPYIAAICGGSEFTSHRLGEAIHPSLTSYTPDGLPRCATSLSLDHMRVVWILGDQLQADHPALERAERERDRVVLVESRRRGGQERYHI